MLNEQNIFIKMRLMGLFCLGLSLASTYAGVTYTIDSQFSKATQSSFTIEGESGNWEIDLEFDWPTSAVKVINGGTIKSVASDMKSAVLTGDPLDGSSHKISIEYRYDDNAGSNLISAKFNGETEIDIGFVSTDTPITVAPIGGKGNYDYGKVIHDSLLFYEAQRAGKLPDSNRIRWRGDSMLSDGKDHGVDLTGGYFDAGDLVKFHFPMAYTLTVLSWGAADYAGAFTTAGELDNVLDAIKWGTDYLMKSHTSETELYGQVGDGGVDHGVWSRPEDWEKDGHPQRPSYKVTSAKGGSDLAGETAAALAAASIAFKSKDASYSSSLLSHAKSIYSFADKYRATYTEEISDAAGFYKSWSGYGDELAWAAAWLYRATDDETYNTEVEKHFAEFDEQLNGRPEQFSWDDKTAGVQVLMAQLTGDTKYKTLAKDFCDYIVNDAPKSPKGMVYLDEWGPLRHAANVAFICLQANNNAGVASAAYVTFAEQQIGYILGDTGRSFVVGVGENPPERPHHRSSSCPNEPVPCDFSAQQSTAANPHILSGALVGGPDKNDAYTDDRTDYQHNEVACDYNAAFTGALAALLSMR